MRAVTRCGVIWTLHWKGHTRSAEIREVAAGGLEFALEKRRHADRVAPVSDGADLLKQSAVERFELDALGWRSD
jgi:hypothetical protein